MTSRREFAAALGGGLLLASCTSSGGVDMVAVTEAIAKVQQAVASACKAAGTIIPTADSVWKVLATLLGVSANVPIMVAVATVEEAISLVTRAACQVVPQQQSRRLGERQTVQVKGSDVTVDFIKV